MRASDLEDILARLPADMLVCVAGARGGAYHIDAAVKNPARYRRAGFGLTSHRYEADGTENTWAPPVVILEGRQALWFEDEPGWGLRGRWPHDRGGS